MGRSQQLLIAVILVLLSMVEIHETNAQTDPRQILQGVIIQLQTGTPNSMWYGAQLWQTIAMQTGNSGVYPQLVQLGQVTNITVTQQQQMPQGMLYAMTVQHMNGQSTWSFGISSLSNRIEYANFNVGASTQPLPSPAPSPSPKPQPTPPAGTPADGTSQACKKFPNLC